MREDSLLKVVVTSRSPSSSEMEDEECKVGIEGREGIPVKPPVNSETGAEGAAVWMPQEERISIQQYTVSRCSKARGESVYLCLGLHWENRKGRRGGGI